MSKIILKSITVNRSIEGDPFTYVGAVVDSDSGYLLPKLYKSTQEMVSDLGSFKYDQMYKDLIANGVPVCLLPVTTPESKYAVCSVRISKESDEGAALSGSVHPKKGKRYQFQQRPDLFHLNTHEEYSLTDSDINQFDFDEKTFGTILDFTNVKLEDLRTSYIIDPVTQRYKDAYWIVMDTGDRLQMFCSEYFQDDSSKGRTITGITTSEYTYLDNDADYFQFNPDNCQTMEEVMDSIKQRWNDPGGPYLEYNNSKCFDLTDLVVNYVRQFCTEHKMPSETLEDNETWFKALIDQSWIEDFWMVSNRRVATILELVADSFGPDVELTEDLVVEQVIPRVPKLLKLMFTFHKPSVKVNRSLLPGIKISTMRNYTQDRLCEFTERTKVVEFYAKMKGPAGQNIVINIENVPYQPELKNITITNGLITEFYTVYTTNISGKKYEDNVIYFTEITNQSKLVEAYIFNYDDEGNYIDDKYWDEDYNKPYNEDYHRGVVYDEDGTPYLTTDLDIPVGTYKLDRITDEEIVDSDYYDSLDIFKGSDWYPDLMLIHEVRGKLKDGSNYIDKILEVIDQPNLDYNKLSTSLYSSALINLDYRQLNREYIALHSDLKNSKYCLLPDRNNRLLYFHGKVYIDGIEYPSFYPYIYNLLYQDYLEYSSVNFRYDPFKLEVGNIIPLSLELEDDKYDPTYSRTECILVTYINKVDDNQTLIGFISKDDQEGSEQRFGILTQEEFWEIDPSMTEDDTFIKPDDGVYWRINMMEYLRDCQVNYLMYDNLWYFWETLNEVYDQSSYFILRYIVSKYSRELAKIRHQLTGLNSWKVEERIQNLNANIMGNFQLIDNSECEITFDEPNNQCSVHFSITVPKLVNKTYYMNFILNV